MKKLKFLLLFCSIFLFFFLWLFPQHETPILMYHRFGCENKSLFVTPENFNRQMKYLKDKKYNVISLNEFVDKIADGKKINRRIVVVTIDDGYQDVYLYAYPILKKYGFPATVFLISDSIGVRKDFLDWDEIRIMLKANINFGAHTRHHPILTALENEKELDEEISGSKKIIEDKLDVSIDYFAYPAGVFNYQVKEVVKKAGYKGACGIHSFATKIDRVYELKRVKVTNSDTNKPFSFWAKLSGYYNVFRKK